MSNSEQQPQQSRQQQREKVVAAYKRSGLSQSQFSRKTGLALSTLSKWLHRSSARTVTPTFAPLAVVDEAPVVSLSATRIAPPLELYFRDDWRLVLPAEFDAASLTRALAVLGEHCVSRR